MIQRFFCACSGAYLPLLWKEEYAFERSRYSGIGAAVFLVSLTALGSFSYAINLAIKKPELSLAAGLLFAALVFNLDRMLVMSLRKPKNGYSLRQYGLVFLRLLVAGLLGFVVTTPLVLRIFQPELDAVHARRVAAQADTIEARAVQMFPDIARLRAMNDSLSKVEQAKHDEIMRIEQRAKHEDDGVYGVPGQGPRWRQDMATMQMLVDQAAILRQDHKIIRERNKASLDSLEREQAAYKQALLTAETDADGLAARLDALHELQEGTPVVATTHLFIVLALMTIEISPVLLKLAMRRGALDAELERMESARIFRSDADIVTAEQAASTWARVDQEALGEEADDEASFRRQQRRLHRKVKTEVFEAMAEREQVLSMELLNRAMTSSTLRNARADLIRRIALGMVDELSGMIRMMFTDHATTQRTAAGEIKRNVIDDMMDELGHAAETREAADRLRQEAQHRDGTVNDGRKSDANDEDGDVTLQYGT